MENSSSGVRARCRGKLKKYWHGERHIGNGSQKKADLILSNGVVYTADRNRGSAEAVAVSDGRIAYVGNASGAASLLGPKTELADLKGRMVLPGFHDCHIHAVGAATYGSSLIPLGGLTAREDLLRRVREYIQHNPDRPDYTGFGWAYASFPATGPEREDLDAICPDRPVFLMSCDLHTAWVNSRALALVGITRETADPRGGCIVRHPVTGEPTGWLKESPAFRLVLNHLSPPDPEQMKKELVKFFHRLSAEGITSILQPGVEYFGEVDIFALLWTLEEEGKLPLRIKAGFTCSMQNGPDPVPVLREMKQKYRGRLFKADTAKLFLDGVMESRTARLLDPYLDVAHNIGKIAWADEDFEGIILALDRERIQTHIHAIGDGAVRLALNSIEKAVQANGHRDLRHTLAHLDLADRADIPRFRQLGVLACFQPAWFHVGAEEKQELLRCLGEKRAMSLYSMRSFLESGAVVTCGSDYPAAGIDGFVTFRPLDGIETGHTRRAKGKAEGECYRPEERVSISDMIDGYTIRAALQFHHEREIGSIEIGKLADLVVLDRNLFETAPHELHKARVLLTLLEGREVFRDGSF